MKGENMRSIFVDLSADEAVSRYCFAGYEGEHNATELVVALPERMVGIPTAEYRFLFETAKGEAIFSAAIPPTEEGTLSVLLPCALMHPPVLKAYVGCYVKHGGEVALATKSSEMLLGVQKSVAEDGGELDVNAGVVPGLVVEDEVLEHSNNPPSGDAVFCALETKVDKTQITDRLDLSTPTRALLPSEWAVVKGLEAKVDRADLKGNVSPLDQATDLRVPTERAVAEALLPLMKKEEYLVDRQISFASENPLQNRAVSQSVAPALLQEKAGRMILIDDASEFSHVPKLVAKWTPPLEHVPRTLLQTETLSPLVEMKSGEGVYQVSEIIRQDPLYGLPQYIFTDGSVWIDSCDRFDDMPESFFDVKVGDYLYYGYNESQRDYAIYTTQEQGGKEVPAAGKTIYVNGRNLATPYNWTVTEGNGIRMEANGENGEITITGKAQEQFVKTFRKQCVLPVGDYVLSINEIGAPVHGVTLFVSNDDYSVFHSVSSGFMKFTISKEERMMFFINVAKGTTVGQIVIRPMLQCGSQFTGYELPEGEQTFTVDENGAVSDLVLSSSPKTMWGDSGVSLELSYHASLTKTVEKMKQKIRDLGGEI